MLETKKVGSVMIVGGGVTGMQAALDLADSGYFVYLVEKTGAIGGAMAQLDKTFPTNDCSMCIIAPKLVECGRHINIELMTLSEVVEVIGGAGDFSVTVKESPRYVDMDKCIACGVCSDECPKKVDSEYDAAIGKRKAIYIKYAQAVPLRYQIDPNSCLWLKKPGSCGECEKVCDAGAINFNDTEKLHNIQVGAIVLAPGFEAYNPGDVSVWGYGANRNVVTSLQLERLLAASGPTGGQLLRPSDRKQVRKVAFLQCIGSRDENLCGNSYCSSVCCMYAIKEAVNIKERVPALQATIFYMDIRTHGKEFDQYLERAKSEAGVRFIRSRVHGVETAGNGGPCRLGYVNEEGKQVEELYDLVVLSVGLQTPKHVLELAETVDIKLTAHNFAATSDFAPVQTSREGIFSCGAIAGPKDIPQAVVEGSAAAASVAQLLAPARYDLARTTDHPQEKYIGDSGPRVGVFVCHCGSNIAAKVDVRAVEDYARSLPDVVFAESKLFSCSQDSQDSIAKCIEEQHLNRIVIAACTPRTHEPLFRQTLQGAGLNEYLVEMANIRNQDSWVHADTPEAATEKAKDLVRMAVAKVRLSESLPRLNVPVTGKGLVVGGGVAGMTAALNLAEQGFEVHLVEKTTILGGNALHLKHTWAGEHVPSNVVKLIDRVLWHDKVIIHKECEVTDVEGYVGNFRSTVTAKDGTKKIIEHGAGVVATGGEPYIPHEYNYDTITGVLTAVQFDKLHELKEKHVKNARRFVFIQCVGSREGENMYCSKVCCTHSVQSAIALKKENPDRNVYILYRDIRTYAQREVLYKQARQLGIIFINYELHGKPKVTDKGKEIEVEVWDHVLHRPLKIATDLVILATAIRPKDDAEDLAKLFNVAVNRHGFYQEAHPKLRPVDFPSDGMFVAGLAHYPKPVEESIAQALAASARAATLLSKESLELDGVKALVDEKNCDGCALCIDVCPYKAITLHEKEGASDSGEPNLIVLINKAQCKGCGLCQGTCPKRGVHIPGFTMEQIGAQIRAALDR